MTAENDPDTDQIEEELTTLEIAEIRDPEEAENDRGNPEVEVAVTQMGRALERYMFEFVRPVEDEEHPTYQFGPYAATNDADHAKHRNDAAYEAAKALAEHTATPVETMVHPTEKLLDRDE